jgi:hypothetical protein
MTAVDYIPIAVGIFAVAMIWLIIADHLDSRRVARCIDGIGKVECPRCKRVLGAGVASTAKQTMVKFTRDGFRQLRGRDYPSRLVAVICPHCSAELEFRLDGSLFSCDHVVAA